MLKLSNIQKDYPGGGEIIHALKGIDLTFRENEFVSILGPSGCGKTTMLNIIGGLDHYTRGDLIINGRSTKDFKDRDWDAYRNYSIGFVFQSYNLIPHQTVLQNVELALSLSGVSKQERRQRAKKALEEVGLGNQLKKRPAEMSGGQMQRVAIARALVNNPDIILADEPTGALDSETSLQVMNILKEIAKDRLVVMVTHNPELAEKYSTRIIRMLDGKIIGDSAPLTSEEIAIETQKEKEKTAKEQKIKKPSMSLGTSFGLSLKNLFTKKGRTTLTAFAGSIGIIGIALVFAVSQGMTTYIDALQEETLSSYPLTLEAQHMDMGTLLETFISKAKSETTHEKDAVYQKGMVYDMLNSLNSMETSENDLKAFKTYIETEYQNENNPQHLNEAIMGIQYTYDTDLLIYTESVDGTIIQSDAKTLMKDLLLEHFGMDMSFMMELGESSALTSQMESLSSMSLSGNTTKLWQEILPGDNGALINPILDKQYDVIYGAWPNAYDEIVVVVDEKNEIDDMTLYALGLKSKEEVDEMAQAAINQTLVEPTEKKWTYEEICKMSFRMILNADCYTLDEKSGLYTDLRETQAGLRYLYDNGMPLKVTGIIRPKEDAVSTMLSGTIGYTSDLTKYLIEKAASSDAVKAQLHDAAYDIFTGLPFSTNTNTLTDSEKAAAFKAYIQDLSPAEKAETYKQMMGMPKASELEQMVDRAVGDLSRPEIEATLLQALTVQMGMPEQEVSSYLENMKDDDLMEIFRQMVAEKIKAEYAQGVAAQLAPLTQDQLVAALEQGMATYTTEQFVTYYEEILEFSPSTYEANLKQLGYVDLDDPSSINLYASSFENKDLIEEAIAAYNADVEELEKITYTDYVGLMMSSVTTIINAITYVLIAFIAISLIVSSIMIGVITLISVQERTKEIGILRAIGASKKNVSSMFNAETVIIGFSSGTLGVLITYLLCIPINLILHKVTGLNNLSAILPVPVALILIAISVLLTLFAGIIPSRSAAKKDPVVALRSE